MSELISLLLQLISLRLKKQKSSTLKPFSSLQKVRLSGVGASVTIVYIRTVSSYRSIRIYIFDNLAIGPESSATFFSRQPTLKCLKNKFLELLYPEIRSQYFGKGSFLPQKQNRLALSHMMIGRRRSDIISSPVEFFCRFYRSAGIKPSVER